jgi:MYXO-CTERM domain-containing protein
MRLIRLSTLVAAALLAAHVAANVEAGDILAGGLPTSPMVADDRFLTPEIDEETIQAWIASRPADDPELLDMLAYWGSQNAGSQTRGVPEPSSAMLAALGLAGLLASTRRRRQTGN